MRIGMYQFSVSGKITENYQQIKSAIHLAKEKDVRLLIFPECSLTGYPPRDIPGSTCIDFDLVHSICEELQKIADKNNISFIVGTAYNENRIYNRAVLFRPNSSVFYYDKRALWGWDKENFSTGRSDGVFEIDGVRFGIRICFEIRFPEYFRELYRLHTDVNLVLFNDVSDSENVERYNLIRGHLQTRAVENVTTTISVNASSPFQTAPTIVFDKSGHCIKECLKNKTELLIYDFERTENTFGENGIAETANCLSARKNY